MGHANRSSAFYPVASVALALVIVAGFSRTFYLRQWFQVPALPSLLYVHGAMFTAWLALFITQVQFVARGRVDLHRRLGIAGAVLAIGLVAVGLAATVASAAIPRPHVGGLSSAQFSLIPLVEIAGFALFIVAALVRRREPQVHKRLMLLAMITAMAPATARLIGLAGLGDHYLLLQTLCTAVFVGWACIADWMARGRVHAVLWQWGAVLVVSWPARMWLAQSDVWAPAGKWIASLAGR